MQTAEEASTAHWAGGFKENSSRFFIDLSYWTRTAIPEHQFAEGIYDHKNTEFGPKENPVLWCTVNYYAVSAAAI